MLGNLKSFWLVKDLTAKLDIPLKCFRVLVINTDKFTFDYLKWRLMKNPIPGAYLLAGLLEILK